MEYKRLTERYKEHIDTKCENCKQWKKFGKGYVCMDMTACDEEIINRLAELEDKIENGTLVELEKPYIKSFALKNSGRYIICKAQEVGISGVLTKAEAKAKLKEMINENK